MKIDVGSHQCIGKRQAQEDAYVVVQRDEEYAALDGYAESSKVTFHLAVMCDGMGGEGNGRICSGEAAKAFAECFLSLSSLGQNWSRRLLMSLYAANSAITEYKIQSDTLELNSGCTLTAALVVGIEEPKLFYLQVGDSPLFFAHYNSRQERMDAIGKNGATCIEYSCPHTRLHMDLLPAVRAGQMDMAQALTDKHANSLVSVLTGGAVPYVNFGSRRSATGKVQPDSIGIPLRPGDFLVLCTDGVTTSGEVEDDVLAFCNAHPELWDQMHRRSDTITKSAMADCLRNHSGNQTAQQAAAYIIREVEQRGAAKQDNASCIVIKITE